jgi:multidrug efflux pump subunit AcrB
MLAWATVIVIMLAGALSIVSLRHNQDPDIAPPALGSFAVHPDYDRFGNSLKPRP